MRKFKFLIILVITSFLFVPFFVNAADTCEIYEGGQCYEITGVANSNPTSISDFTISGSLVDFNFTEFEMDLFRNENSSVMATNISNHLIWLCNFKNKVNRSSAIIFFILSILPAASKTCLKSSKLIKSDLCKPFIKLYNEE